MRRKNWKVSYVYLHQQFADIEPYLRRIKKVVETGDFTLGEELRKFEKNFAKKLKVKHAIGVASGTDALILTMKACGIKNDDEVITAPNSFIATAGTIAAIGARPVFVDVRDDYTLDPQLIESGVTSKTKAIIPVHLTGFPADLYPIWEIAKKYKLMVIEDAAQAAMAKYDDKFVGTLGMAGIFSFHPLKILNVWGDGGMITTNDDNLAEKIKLWRNHGLKNREEAEFFGFNSRFQTILAAVANCELPKLERIVAKKVKFAKLYDKYLSELEPDVHIPSRNLSKVLVKPVFTSYVIQATRRDELIKYLNKKGIEVVVHYPIPIHLQKAARYLGYKRGDFPVCEKQADTILTLPNHQYLDENDILYVANSTKGFYRNYA